ncbi:MAG: tRNA (adenosine(37)-N6)-dimethylallyltransferase MiaA [Acutalibacteraceae bacterium]
MDNKTRLIAVAGPTASGKTSLSIELAKKYNGEIVSADSMQIYKGMDIATAKPTKEEMQGIPHHLIDFLSPTESFSVSEYVTLAKSAIDDITKRGKLPILCGGTGLYVRSLVENVKFSEEKTDEKLREELNERYKKEGGETLLKELAQFDEETAKTLHPNNGKRIIRAIEIYRTTGITMSQHIKNSKNEPSPYDLTAIGITYADRQKLYDRINLRVDIMMKNGLLKEAEDFYSRYNSNTASAAIGYKELKPYLDGEIPLDTAVEKLKQETRHYAKRQLTWFRRDEYINWIEADKCTDILAKACEIIENKG